MITKRRGKRRTMTAKHNNNIIEKNKKNKKNTGNKNQNYK